MLKAILALSAVCVLAFALSAWSFYNGHRNACDSRDASLNVIRDVLVFTQQANSGHESKKAVAFYAFAFARIEAARC